MELHGPTVSLRLPHPAHSEPLFALASDPQVTRWFSWGPYAAVVEAETWIDAQRERRELGEQLDFVVVRDGAVAGVTGLGEVSRRDRRAVVGTWLGREHWGTGANAESKALVAHLAFVICGLERLGAYSNPANGRSTAALEQIGFIREGTLRRWHRHGAAHHDVHVFGLLREDWERSPLREVPVTARGAPPPAWFAER